MTLPGIDWATLLGGSAVGGAILAGCVAVGDDGPPLAYVRLALVALAAAAAFVLDEPAAAAADAVPRTRRRRAVTRTVALVVPLMVWVSAVLALELRSAATPVLGLLVEGVGLVAVATAGAAVLRHLGHDQPGEVVASAVGAVVLAALVYGPRVGSVPVFPAADRWVASTAAWGCVTVASVILVVAASRDPFRR